ncbi:hypothetical protein GIB67_010140 [Kingdonia uniflora]|uniref:tRNA(Ile)-lysidine synthetase n=1 Tax=Kingdonia uniflora TaxID=39325 RepID=A0A7J7NAX0_9MAGN|nr:hypothetical protein GIB67_010140 [Kingdonia uniflora]
MMKSVYFPSNQFICINSSTSHEDMSKYRVDFSRRMEMSGLKPHHRIAIGVSGGPDSIALCVLTAEWKRNDALIPTEGCVDGLLAIVVDHGLREESKDEAECVHNRVFEMGIRCEIKRCEWVDGRPRLGCLQEMARDMRYQIFQNVCIENQIGVLLIAHHADDQAELFILRLSRSSGVLGLAGMAFTSHIFPAHTSYCDDNSGNHGILLVRPLLEFSKEDLYNICQGGHQEWVEDPTNQSLLFARNRIRTSLNNLSSCIFKSELQAIISACRQTRSFIDKMCTDLINVAVTVNVHGYAIIDLEKLDPLNLEDVCLSKFVVLVLQFISQRHRPVRGKTSKLALDYIRNLPCKTSLTVAGCYLSAVPQSKGTKVLVCSSPQSPHLSEMKLPHIKYLFDGRKHCLPMDLNQIIMDGKSYSDRMVPDASNVHFVHATSSECILSEAKILNILSESTHRNILLLQREEITHFYSKPKTKPTSEDDPKNEMRFASVFLSESLESGKFYHFMNRFLFTWRLHKNRNSEGIGPDSLCRSCVVGRDTVSAVRHMVDTDWLYLAKLSNGQIVGDCQDYGTLLASKMDHRIEKVVACSDYVRFSAQRALQVLKSIPLAARRGLPVLVNSQGLLLSIPSICFEHCPYLSVCAVFKPRIPLGGGHSSFI